MEGKVWVEEERDGKEVKEEGKEGRGEEEAGGVQLPPSGRIQMLKGDGMNTDTSRRARCHCQSLLRGCYRPHPNQSPSYCG